MIKAIKVRIKPTQEQQELMWKSVGVARWAYNFALDMKQKTYKEQGKSISEGEIRKLITKLKKTENYKWLNEVSAQIPKQAVKDSDIAYNNFFKGKSKFPKFKSRKRSKKSFYVPYDKLKVFNNRTVQLEKIGIVKTSEQIPTNVKYSNPIISFDNKYWYISVGVEVEELKEELTGESLGIDLGVKDLAVCSNGKVYKNINKSKLVKDLEKRLKRFQRQVSKKYIMNKRGGTFVKTNNIIKLENKIQLIHRRLTNIRNNHIHQTTSEIVKTKPSQIVIEDLNISGMMKNKHLSKAIQNQKLYEFRRQLEYKCKLRGIELVIADRFYPSSKKCSNCNNIKRDLNLSDRIYTCGCGLSIDRDFNASINLSKYKLV